MTVIINFKLLFLIGAWKMFNTAKYVWGWLSIVFNMYFAVVKMAFLKKYVIWLKSIDWILCQQMIPSICIQTTFHRPIGKFLLTQIWDDIQLWLLWHLLTYTAALQTNKQKQLGWLHREQGWKNCQVLCNFYLFYRFNLPYQQLGRSVENDNYQIRSSP